MSSDEVRRLEEKIDNIARILNGNGKPGLISRIVNLEASGRAYHSWTTWLFRLLVATALAVIVKKLYGV